MLKVHSHFVMPLDNGAQVLSEAAGARVFAIDPDAYAAVERVQALSLASLLAGPQPAGVGADGVARIQVTGSLSVNGSAGAPGTTYRWVEAECERLAAEDACVGAVFDMASPGGDTTGMIEATAAIGALSAVKPTVAWVGDTATSACYCLASACRSIVVAEFGKVGSLGTMIRHECKARANDQAGIDVTYITAGAHKGEGNADEPLPEHVVAEYTDLVNRIWDRLLQTVAGNRPSLTVAHLRGLEARSFVGEDAVGVGLADCVGVYADAIKLVAGEQKMSRQADAQSGGATPALDRALTQANMEARHDASPRPQAIAPPLAAEPSVRHPGGHGCDVRTVGQAAAAARLQERERVAAILSSDEAAVVPSLARHLAHDTDMPTAVALEALSEAVWSGSAPATDVVYLAGAGVPGAGTQGGVQSQDRDRGRAIGRMHKDYFG
ncbi:MAG: S49 family peptidase [Pseudomonadota bacterium]